MNRDDISVLFRLYEQKMYHIANAILRDPYAAEDAVMDAFARMMNSRLEIDDPESAGTKQLLIRVTRSAAIDLYRKKKRDGTVFSEDDRILSDLVAGPENADVLLEIESMLDDLPALLRRVLTLRFLRDRSVKETAEILHIRETAVRKRQQRAIEAIRKNLERNEKDERIYSRRV